MISCLEITAILFTRRETGIARGKLHRHLTIQLGSYRRFSGLSEQVPRGAEMHRHHLVQAPHESDERQGTTITDVTQVTDLLPGEEFAVYKDLGHTGVEEHEIHKAIWQIAARNSTYPSCNNAGCTTGPSARSILQSTEASQG